MSKCRPDVAESAAACRSRWTVVTTRDCARSSRLPLAANFSGTRGEDKRRLSMHLRTTRAWSGYLIAAIAYVIYPMSWLLQPIPRLPTMNRWVWAAKQTSPIFLGNSPLVIATKEGSIMKKLLVCVLVLNALLVGDRIFLAFAVSPGGAAGPAASPCESDRTLHSLDSNGSGDVDFTDAIHLLTWLFLDADSPPEVCLAQDNSGLQM